MGGATAAIAGLALLLAAMGKSAQVPLQGWLQDAMAGPTPVSGLLHSATLVVAGVVLLARAFPFLPSGVLLAVGLVGGATALVAGVIAIAQRDLKRLLAASTASQLGLMLLALGAGSVPAAIVHLVAHAAMKSALFLGAGVFQHRRHGTAFADLRGVGRERRGAFIAFVVAGLALAGVPPLAGFWSKDAVIAATFHSSRAGLFGPLALGGTVLTGVYVGRAIRLLWRETGDREPGGDTEPGGGWMAAGLAGLVGLAAVLGVALAPIGRLLDEEIPEDTTGLVLGLAAAAAGLVVGWSVPAHRLLRPAYVAALGGFRLGSGLDGFVVRPALAVGSACTKVDRTLHAAVLAVGHGALGTAAAGRRRDRGVHEAVEGVGRTSLALARASRVTDEAGIDGLIATLVNRTQRLGGLARRLQTGLVHRELLVAAGGTAIVLIIALLF